MVYEDANNPGFNRIRFQAGNGPAYMDFDEVRVIDHGTMSFPMTVVAVSIAQKTSMETALSASATSSRRCLLGDPLAVLQTLTATVPLPSAMCSRCCPHSAPAKARPNS